LQGRLLYRFQALQTTGVEPEGAASAANRRATAARGVSGPPGAAKCVTLTLLWLHYGLAARRALRGWGEAARARALWAVLQGWVRRPDGRDRYAAAAEEDSEDEEDEEASREAEAEAALGIPLERKWRLTHASAGQVRAGCARKRRRHGWLRHGCTLAACHRSRSHSPLHA
jgi:hypothetical protein